MLRRKYRLIGRLSKRSNIFSTPYFNLKLAQNSLPQSRFGFIVSKKIDKRAAVRNRIKRILRSCAEENLESIKGGYDFAFVLKSPIVGENRTVICESVNVLLKEQNLIK